MYLHWKGLQKPNRLQCNEATLTDSYGEFWAEPFERGFGITIGNALRRVMLSSLQGTAITSVQIEGVLHEFSPMPNIVEDVTDFILNLKGVLLKIKSSQPKFLTLNIDKPGQVTAGDIKADSEVEIINKDHHLATIEPGGKLNAVMKAQVGRGLVPAEQQDSDDLTVGTIPIDAVYSPVRKVNFTIENTRVGKSTEYERLNLEVKTDGTIKPDEAIIYSAKILADHFNIFLSGAKFDEEDVLTYTDNEQAVDNKLFKSVEELELSVRAQNCLIKAGILTIGDLVQKTDAEMLETKNFGKKSLKEIKAILDKMGLELGMNLEKETLKKLEEYKKTMLEDTKA